MKRTLLFCFFIFLLLNGVQNRVYAVNYGKISVQEIPMTSDAGTSTSYGYLEYRFRVTNKDAKAHTVGLEIPKTSFSRYQTALSRSANSVVVPPESAVILRLLQPAFPMNGSGDAQVIIDGRYQKDPTPFRKINNHGQSYYSHEIANIFTSRDVPGDLRNLFQIGIPPEKPEHAEGATATAPTGHAVSFSGHGGTSAPPELMPWTSNVPVEEWSDYWLAYTRFDAIIVIDSEWREIQERHAGIFDALKKYVEAGGILGVVGTNWSVPKHWLPAEDDTQNSARKYQAVLGLVYVFDKNMETAKPAIEPFRETVLKQTKLWRDTYDHRPAGSSIIVNEARLLSLLPVVADYGINIKLIMVLIIVFAVLIGPVNIYVLSLMKRRIWLMWTVPLTSLVAGVSVLSVSLFQEGFLRQSSSATYTVLDQQREEAVTFGFVGFYSTLTPRGLIFAPETEATACITPYRNSKSLEFYLIAGGNQFLTHGWINARIPSYFAIRKAQSQRKERITFDWTADSPTAANGLGVDINKLTVCSPKGELLTAHHIKAGEKVSLTVSSIPKETIAVPITISKSGAFNEIRQTYSQIIPNGPGTFISSNHLPAGSYLAELEVWNPFVEEGLDRTTPYQNKTIIFGLFE
ncbi:MAG: hypothetical protein LBF88_06480 [Planctomycetaceae bacterium]|jgi:hypothetical protein|nr:hypothetical protein [Planctomycetaceae bacterium]